jgi:hypothetical protein
MVAMAAKSKAKSASKSNRGGSRPGAGRKPKAVTEMRAALIAPLVIAPTPTTGEQVQAACMALSDRKAAAQFALDLFEENMRDVLRAIDVRLDCAREVLNRTIGKPRIADAPAKGSEDEEQVHIYMPDNGRGSVTA